MEQELDDAALTKTIKNLAIAQNAIEEVARHTGLTPGVVRRRFKALIARYGQQGRSEIKRAQFALAAKGNAAMLIWLGRQYLGQRPAPQRTVEERSVLVRDAVRPKPKRLAPQSKPAPDPESAV